MQVRVGAALSNLLVYPSLDGRRSASFHHQPVWDLAGSRKLAQVRARAPVRAHLDKP